ncbi:transposase [Streptomyces sp. NPDC060031]|uniref:transposase n=1 Tax=Streptomyces sp. NPDC060031 TaxID=3347043 RepID=UPI0036ABA20A
MARPSKYSAEFRSDAVALWRAAAGRRTLKDAAADLNVNPETLRTWVRDADGRPVAVAVGASQDQTAHQDQYSCPPRVSPTPALVLIQRVVQQGLTSR